MIFYFKIICFYFTYYYYYSPILSLLLDYYLYFYFGWNCWLDVFWFFVGNFCFYLFVYFCLNIVIFIYLFWISLSFNCIQRWISNYMKKIWKLIMQIWCWKILGKSINLIKHVLFITHIELWYNRNQRKITWNTITLKF